MRSMTDNRPLTIKKYDNRPSAGHRELQPSEYQTRQADAGCLPQTKQLRYAFLAVFFSSKGPECELGWELPH
jgi:hypothetical protein